MVLFRPTEFFNAIKAESGYREPVKFLIITSAVIGFLNFLTGLALESVLGPLTPNDFPIDPAVYAILAVPMTITGYVVGAFVSAALIHIVVRYFKGTGNYRDTFRASAYDSAPLMLNFIPIIGGLIGSTWSIIILTTGLKTLHNLTTTKAVLSWLIPPIVILIVASIIFLTLTYSIVSLTQ